MKNLALVLALAFLASTEAHAWGKRGHSLVCQTAAYLGAQAPKGEFLKAHSFDLGYYCNVPDIIWKKNSYEQEWFNHFMDLEIFEREMRGTKVLKPFELSRGEFDAEFASIPNKAGRSWWRVRELIEQMDQLATTLKKTDISKDDRNKAQENWLLRAGIIGHYIADLVQPLHVTENYDGQLTEQKGIHSFYEEEVVDELFLNSAGSLEQSVMVEARKKEKALIKQWEKKSTLEILQAISEQSNKRLPALLKTDKRVGRKDIKKAAAAYRSSIVDEMATGAVALSVLWKRQLGWDYDGVRFYNFNGAPEFIALPTPKPAASASPTPRP